MAACEVDGCSTTASVRKMCKTHYSRWYRHGDVTFRKNKPQMGPCSVEGCDRPQKTNHLCGAHQRRAYKWGDPRADIPLRPPYEHTRVKTQQGYVRIKVPGHPRQRSAWVLEHIVVMEGVLHRQLLPGENVHHINGARDDNRPENLELWVVSQPAGQRVEDLVAWAEEVLARYK